MTRDISRAPRGSAGVPGTFLICALAIAALPASGVASAQAVPSPPSTPAAKAPGIAVVGVPIPISNEAIGSGLAGVVGVIVPTGPAEEKLPASVLGVGGGYTSSGTWAAFGGGQLHLGADRARLLGGYARAELHYDLFGTGTDAGDAGRSVPILQPGTGAVAEGLVRTAFHIFAGARYVHISSTIGLDGELTQPPPVTDDLVDPDGPLHVRSDQVSARVLRDTRSDQFWPIAGSLIDIMAGAVRTEAPAGIGWFQAYEASANWYVRTGARGVLATRVMACGVGGDRVPFYELCQFGFGADLRGYEAGRYRDRLMSAGQAEYRFAWRTRLAFVAFGGVGEVAPDWRGWTVDNLLPAGGVGIRFSLSKDYRVNYRVDYAYGKTGGQWIVSIGEAF